mmetsp:Transcript_11821/g.17891  ORF Transcript_11821/g.17891 Transcript_11821/m.17891 type:complete len:238 (+) Transcript_11821:163-876(+)
MFPLHVRLSVPRARVMIREWDPANSQVSPNKSLDSILVQLTAQTVTRRCCKYYFLSFMQHEHGQSSALPPDSKMNLLLDTISGTIPTNHHQHCQWCHCLPLFVWVSRALKMNCGADEARGMALISLGRYCKCCCHHHRLRWDRYWAMGAIHTRPCRNVRTMGPKIRLLDPRQFLCCLTSQKYFYLYLDQDYSPLHSRMRECPFLTRLCSRWRPKHPRWQVMQLLRSALRHHHHHRCQ